MTRSIPFFIIGCILMVTGEAAAICQNAADCCAGYNAGYCCPNGKTDTTYSCPTGWILSLSGNTCTRVKDLETSDAKGYYQQTYGTCNATAQSTSCYNFVQAPPETYKCFQCAIYSGGKI